MKKKTFAFIHCLVVSAAMYGEYEKKKRSDEETAAAATTTVRNTDVTRRIMAIPFGVCVFVSFIFCSTNVIIIHCHQRRSCYSVISIQFAYGRTYFDACEINISFKSKNVCFSFSWRMKQKKNQIEEELSHYLSTLDKHLLQ